ncbi:dTMP kinase [Demetria terragena]|uniref:dTMP kinase n=1 Tax=Demetria terragena TaxID=63959 RepID=UPI0003696833|nr:dTMP kinase [Demetria terragena]
MPEQSPTTRGVFIVFEGGDGAGKTTQLDRLVYFLRSRDEDVVVTREPGGTTLGHKIRELVLHGEDVAPRAEALLFAADRAHHVATVVRPALERGVTVVQDRYIDSSVAYQGAGRDLDPGEIAQLSAWATHDLRPDLTVLLDVTPELGHTRRSGTHDRLEREADEFHAKVRAHFLQLAEAEPQRYVVLSAEREPDEIAADVQRAVTDLLDGRVKSGTS